MAMTIGPVKYVGVAGGSQLQGGGTSPLMGPTPTKTTSPILQGGSTSGIPLQGSTLNPQDYILDNSGGGSSVGTGTGTGTGGPSVDPAAVARIMAGLSGIDDALGVKNQASNQAYKDMIGQYDQAFGMDKTAHDDSVLQNEKTYTGNNWDAILNGIRAYSGLRGVLSSLGALGGSGIDVLNGLVNQATSADAGNARSAFDANAGQLSTAWNQALLDDSNRRVNAKTTLDNELSNNKASALTAQQGIYEKLASLYGADTAEGQNYASKAVGFTPDIVKATKTASNPYAKASTLFSPGELQDYLAGTQNLNASVSNGSSSIPVNSPVFATKSQRERLQGVA